MRSASAALWWSKPQQMQEAVHDKMGGMVGERLAFLARLPAPPFRTPRTISPSIGRRGDFLRRRSGKGQHVGGFVEASPLCVQRANLRVVGELHADFRAVEDLQFRSPQGWPLMARSRQISRLPARRATTERIRRFRHSASSRRSVRARMVGALIGGDDAAHEIVPHDIAMAKHHMADAFETAQQRHRLRSDPDFCPGGKSVWVGSPLTIIREPSPRRVRNIFICIEVAFCASSSNDDGFRQSAPAHEGERRNFDHARSGCRARPSGPSMKSCRAS